MSENLSEIYFQYIIKGAIRNQKKKDFWFFRNTVVKYGFSEYYPKIDGIVHPQASLEIYLAENN